MVRSISILENNIMSEKTYFPLTKAALNKALRSTIVKAYRYPKDAGRKFPQGYGTAPWPMLERLTVDAEDNGTVHIDYAGDPHFTPAQTAAYVAEFCKLNHLRG